VKVVVVVETPHPVTLESLSAYLRASIEDFPGFPVEIVSLAETEDQ
jgi:hypothetical protein